jgi:hypothetical protein
MKINRMEFLQATGCCAALALIQRVSGETVAAPPSAAAPPPAPSGQPLSPAEQRVAFGETWAKRFFDVFDANLDPETRERIMRANGRACHEGSRQNASAPPSVDAFISRVRAIHGEEAIRREGDVVYFSYIQNPRGLKVADGYCLCPLVETGPKGLSGTYCLCSVGYVQHMFEGMAGHPVKVTLLESLKRGGKGCRFKIELS